MTDSSGLCSWAGRHSVAGQVPRMPAPSRVLIVDDDPLTRLAVRIELEANGYRVVDEAATGYDAISLAAVHEPDFIILDQMMPMLAGHDALPAVVSAAPGARVVIYTSVDSPVLALDVLRDGAAGFVSKQRDVAELIALLDELDD